MYKINTKRLVKTFIEMAKISSPSWREDAMRTYLINAVKNLGVKTRIFPCGESYNLLITLRGDGKRRPVLLSGHMDTVTPCDRVKPIATPAKITSDGTTILGSDDKAALAMFLESLRYIAETGMSHGPVEILITCAEEVGLRGMKGFDTSFLQSKLAFVFDSDGPIGKIVMQAPFQSSMEINITGKAAHAGLEPERGINAINVLSEIISLLPSGRIDSETTVNVGTITGGRANNIVAERASCTLEARSLNFRKLKAQESAIRTTAARTAARHGARCTMKRSLEYSGFTIRPGDRIAKIAVGALERIGIKPQLEVSGGGSDTNILNASGIAAVNLSAGMRQVHSTAEYIMVRDLINGTRAVLSIIETV